MEIDACIAFWWGHLAKTRVLARFRLEIDECTNVLARFSARERGMKQKVADLKGMSKSIFKLLFENELSFQNVYLKSIFKFIFGKRTFVSKLLSENYF